MNQNEPIFLNLYSKRHRNAENIRSINDLGNYVRKEA